MTINDLFDITIDGKIDLSPAALATPIFRVIYDGIEDKFIARKEIEYIIFQNHWMTPYNAGYPLSEERSAVVKKDLFGDPNYKLSPITIESEKRYLEEFQTNEAIQALKSARIGLAYITKSLNNVDDTNEKPSEVLKWVKDLGPAITSLDTIEQKVKANELSARRVKGDREIGAFELPKRNMR